MSGTTHHGGLDGAAAGGLAGQEGHHGHTERDAVIGAVGGHKAEKYHEHKQAEGKPGVGAKISGTLDELVGKVTSNPAKVQEGESKKTGGI